MLRLNDSGSRHARQVLRVGNEIEEIAARERPVREEHSAATGASYDGEMVTEGGNAESE